MLERDHHNPLWAPKDNYLCRQGVSWSQEALFFVKLLAVEAGADYRVLDKLLVERFALFRVHRSYPKISGCLVFIQTRICDGCLTSAIRAKASATVVGAGDFARSSHQSFARWAA